MKNKIVVGILLIILSFFMTNIQTFVPVYAQEETIKAEGMCVIEKSSKRILYAKDENKRLSNASTTKIVTFLTVLKHCNNLDKLITVDDRAIGIEGTSIYLKPGEKLTIKELLYGMMLVSGNDAATALALAISPNIKDFANLMTEEAKKCGALNSSFMNPHGLDEQNHYTTAYDLALITRECYNYDIFKKIVSTKQATIPNLSGKRYLKNKNKLLKNLKGCIGVKTGYTKQAGRCLVSSAIRNNMQVICVVLNCQDMFNDSANLIEDSYKNYKLYNLLPSYNFIKEIPVLNADTKLVKLYTQKGLYYPLLANEYGKIKTKINMPNILSAPIKKEQIVGNIKIYLNNDLIFCEKIYTMEEIKSNKVTDNLKKIISNW